jgi:hypothetical protein
LGVKISGFFDGQAPEPGVVVGLASEFSPPEPDHPENPGAAEATGFATGDCLAWGECYNFRQKLSTLNFDTVVKSRHWFLKKKINKYETLTKNIFKHCPRNIVRMKIR